MSDLKPNEEERMRLRKTFAALGAAAAIGACGAYALPATGSEDGGGLSASIKAADGSELGTVTVRQEGGSARVEIRGHGMPPGFHGLHVHAVGKCDGPGFTSSGPHLGDGAHPGHTGDLPVLYVKAHGEARAVTYTDRFSVADLADADGSALIVHAMPDNYANIPERYAPDGPDMATRMAGDSGARIACAVLR
jgi:Cu-Zn family superoxide dismutase